MLLDYLGRGSVPIIFIAPQMCMRARKKTGRHNIVLSLTPLDTPGFSGYVFLFNFHHARRLAFNFQKTRTLFGRSRHFEMMRHHLTIHTNTKSTIGAPFPCCCCSVFLCIVRYTMVMSNIAFTPLQAASRSPRTMVHRKSQTIFLIVSLVAVFMPLDVSAESHRRHRRGEGVTSAPSSGKSGKAGLLGGSPKFPDGEVDGDFPDFTEPGFFDYSLTQGPAGLSPRMTLSPSFLPSSQPSAKPDSKKKTSSPTVSQDFSAPVTVNLTNRPSLSPVVSPVSTFPPDNAEPSSSSGSLPAPAVDPAEEPSSSSGSLPAPTVDPASEPSSSSGSPPLSTNSPVMEPTSGTFAPFAPTSTSAPATAAGPSSPSSSPPGPTAGASVPVPTSTPSAPFTSPISEGDFTDSSGPYEMGDSAVVCPGMTPDLQEVVWWTYSVTLQDPKYTSEDADGAVEALEVLLRSDLLGLLQCDNPTMNGERNLASDFGIVGVDYLPDDLREEECQTNSSLPCYVYIGSMFLYLQEDANVDIAVFETRKAIQEMMRGITPGWISKVEGVEYLAPDLSDPSAAETSEANSSQPSNEISSSPAIPILSAVGAVFFVLTLVAAYRFRKDRPEALDGPSTVGPSTLTGGPGTPKAAGASLEEPPADTPAPPFTGMLPGVYRQSYRMGAILEDGSDSASYSRSSDIIVSECGYTDDDSSRDHSYLNSMLNEDPILGARGMDEDYEPDDSDYLYDTMEPPPLSRGSSGKEVRFSTEA